MTNMTNYEEEFSGYLVKCWSDAPRHSYRRRKLEWCASSLEAAFKSYWWYGSYDTTEQKLTEYGARLVAAIDAKADSDALATCLDIFKWGRVAKKPSDGSNKWVLQTAADGMLCTRLATARSLLAESTSDLRAFDGKTLVMNSAMTKVVTLADPSKALAIYDGRVGAALGFFARHFLALHGIKGVPQELHFPWGAAYPTKGKPNSAGSRNPSQGGYDFQELFGLRPNDFHHADAMRRASFLLKKVSSKLDVSVRQLEAALFMWGYSVRQTPVS